MIFDRRRKKTIAILDFIKAKKHKHHSDLDVIVKSVCRVIWVQISMTKVFSMRGSFGEESRQEEAPPRRQPTRWQSQNSTTATTENSTPADRRSRLQAHQASVQLQGVQYPCRAADVGGLVQQVHLCDSFLERRRATLLARISFQLFWKLREHDVINGYKAHPINVPA